MKYIISLIIFSGSFVRADNLSYFKPSYEEAKAQFLSSVTDVENKKIFQVHPFQFTDPNDVTLTTDVAWLQSSPRKGTEKKLMVIFSGLHGIEGFTGSAIQSWMLNEKLSPNVDYLFVHAVNPWGFKNFRRVNQSNIDLNRNMVLNVSDFQTQNKAYSEINSFLNPDAPAHIHFFSKLSFIFSSVKLIIQYSMESLRKAILVGQYELPKGLYYGGSSHQYQKNILDQLHHDVISHYAKAFLLDLHTGYGKRGYLHILANSKKQSTAPDLISAFGEDRIDFGDKKNFYQTNGDLITYLERKANISANQKFIGATFEFGTLDSQNSLGSIESLRRMVLENQKFHFGGDSESAANVYNLFKEMFYPSDTEWRLAVIEQASVQLTKVELSLK